MDINDKISQTVGKKFGKNFLLDFDVTRQCALLDNGGTPVKVDLTIEKDGLILNNAFIEWEK